MFKRFLVIALPIAICYKVATVFAHSYYLPAGYWVGILLVAYLCVRLYSNILLGIKMKKPSRWAAAMLYHGHTYYVSEIDEEGAIVVTHESKDAAQFENQEDLHGFMANVKGTWSAVKV